MDCCNYVDYRFPSIYNYNRSQYNEGGYNFNSNYNQSVPYFHYNNHGYDTSHTSSYHHPIPHHNHYNNHNMNDYNSSIQNMPHESYHYNDHDRTVAHDLVGYQYSNQPPPPPPPLPPAQLWGTNSKTAPSATG